jgi:hypothetical protein
MVRVFDICLMAWSANNLKILGKVGDWVYLTLETISVVGCSD